MRMYQPLGAWRRLELLVQLQQLHKENYRETQELHQKDVEDRRPYEGKTEEQRLLMGCTDKNRLFVQCEGP